MSPAAVTLAPVTPWLDHDDFDDHDDEIPLQAPLPFPGVAPVLPAPIERDDIGPLRHRCAQFVQALVEVIAGERPARQMVTWFDASVHDQLTRQLRAQRTLPSGVARRRSTARLVSLHVAMVNDNVAEVAARMVQQGRSRAIAVRLEPQLSHRGERVWRCTALQWA